MDSDLVRMDLSRIVINEQSDSQVIVLTEREDRARTFVIIIGPYEAAAIDRKIRGIQTPRPLTHDLVQQVIEALGGTLKSVVINDLRDATYYARLIVERQGRLHDIDARPSDAIALAVEHDTPIFCARHVLEAAGSSE